MDSRPLHNQNGVDGDLGRALCSDLGVSYGNEFKVWHLKQPLRDPLELVHDSASRPLRVDVCLNAGVEFFHLALSVFSDRVIQTRKQFRYRRAESRLAGESGAQ